MSIKRVNLKDFAKELGKFTDASLHDQKAAVARGLVRSIPDLVAASPVDTGLYAQSWDYRVDDQGGTIGNTAPHAAIIEYGARPFKPPIRPLLEWAKRRLQDSSQPVDKMTVMKNNRSGKGPQSTLSGYSSEVWALAVSVQKKIAERGILPHHILENAIPGIIENIRKEFEELG